VFIVQVSAHSSISTAQHYREHSKAENTVVMIIKAMLNIW